MQNNLGFMVLASDVKASSKFYSEVLGFVPLVVMDWYASHKDPHHEGVFIDLVKEDHEAAGQGLANKRTSGVMLALSTDDCDATYAALLEKHANLEVLAEPKDEPWGQRRFQIQAPDGVVIEYVQPIAPDMEWMKANGIE